MLLTAHTGRQWVTGWPHRHVVVHVASHSICRALLESYVACLILSLPYVQCQRIGT